MRRRALLQRIAAAAGAFVLAPLAGRMRGRAYATGGIVRASDWDQFYENRFYDDMHAYRAAFDLAREKVVFGATRVAIRWAP